MQWVVGQAAHYLGKLNLRIRLQKSTTTSIETRHVVQTEKRPCKSHPLTISSPTRPLHVLVTKWNRCLSRLINAVPLLRCGGAQFLPRRVLIKIFFTAFHEILEVEKRARAKGGTHPCKVPKLRSPPNEFMSI